MSITQTVRDEARQRAVFACEYCGISETDAGGELTLDHFQPISYGGTDDPANLLYCCIRCNQYKGNYWPLESIDPQLWNPRRAPAADHFVELDDSVLHALTATGSFTLKMLKLNRPPLLAYRRRKRLLSAQSLLLAQYRDLLTLDEQLLLQQRALIEQQQKLLAEQASYLRLFLR